MIKNSSKQTGSAHVVIIVILVVALIGTLGFVFWQNFFNKEVKNTNQNQEVAKTEEPKKDVAEKNNIFEGEKFNFEYPTKGWSIVNLAGVGLDSDVNLQTDDYKPLGMGVESGALIAVYTPNTNGQNLEEQMNQVQNFPGSQDVKKTMVNSFPAFTYNSGYEGVRYHTVIFVNDALTYDIVYRFEDGGDVNTHKKAYDLVTSTFKIHD